MAINSYATTASAQEYLGQSGQVTARDKTAIDQVHDTMIYAVELSARVEALSERLCGVVSINEKSTSEPPLPSGVLSLLETKSRSTFMSIEKAMLALNRIESQI